MERQNGRGQTLEADMKSLWEDPAERTNSANHGPSSPVMAATNGNLLVAKSHARTRVLQCYNFLRLTLCSFLSAWLGLLELTPGTRPPASQSTAPEAYSTHYILPMPA
jgi:hypothetical protein